ncbi:MAG TPA: hypothetical protein VM509_15965 [Planctomycetota bacterium]|nr:hypothetical protein [Planctomycetota bacterium]
MKPSAARFHALALGIAALAPLLRPARHDGTEIENLPAFPDAIEGRKLVPSATSEIEIAWLASFPGRIGRFSDGERLWILRQTAQPTLRLHSSARCLRAAGWEVEPAHALRDAEGRIWSAYVARRSNLRALVRERVASTATSASWPDVDAWRWDAWLGRDPGPWCAYTSIEMQR